MSDTVSITAVEDGVRFAVHVQPRARSNQVCGVHGQAIKVRLVAPPVEGAANKALVKFLSGQLGVPKSHVSIIHGETSRHKVVEVLGVTPSMVRALLAR